MSKTKRGQTVFGLSYGVIFSIIIIVFIVAVAFFAIKHFLGLNRCTQIGFFYDNLEDEVQRAWTSGRYGDVYVGKLPKSGIFKSEIDKVCFGRLSLPPSEGFANIHEELSDYVVDLNSHNVFLYPTENACDGELFAYNLKCGQSDCLTTEQSEFFCKDVEDDGNVEISLRKEITDSQVKVMEN